MYYPTVSEGGQYPRHCPSVKKVSFGPSWQVLVKVCLRMGQRTSELGPGDAHDDGSSLGTAPTL